ncbi:hypothetical protein KKE45_00135 [Patescibacteria group bacterium]|nr:hypothetical protein [Patescibacteria group bacterium]
MTLNASTFLIFAGLVSVVAMISGHLKAEDKRKYLVQEVVIGVPVIILLFLFGPLILLSPIKPGFASIGSEKLTVYYPKGRPDDGKELWENAQRAVKTLEDFYQIPVKTKVLMAGTRLDSLRLTGNPTAGGTGSDLGVIVCYDKANEGVIIHEISHIILPKMTGRSGHFFPRWFDEGLASYLGRMDYYRGLEGLKESLEDGFYKRDLSRWNGLRGKINWTVFDVKCCGHQIYGQTYEMIKFLFDNYGKDKVYELLLNSKKLSFEQAFDKTFGLSVDQYHEEFIDFVKRNAF